MDNCSHTESHIREVNQNKEYFYWACVKFLATKQREHERETIGQEEQKKITSTNNIKERKHHDDRMIEINFRLVVFTKTNSIESRYLHLQKYECKHMRLPQLEDNADFGLSIEFY